MISYTLDETAQGRHARTIITICRCSTSGPSPRRDQLPLPRITTLMSWLDAVAISTGPILRPVKKGNRPPLLHGS
jgi:hypothetical protein